MAQSAGHVRLAWAGPDRGHDIRYTFWPDGLRATAPERLQRRPEVPLVGCSYTQGWAGTDEETYAWQLQTMLPDVTVLNYGTAGYGTYQSLLALEQHFARAPGPVPLVVYGLIQGHELRSVAPASWLRVLTQRIPRPQVPGYGHPDRTVHAHWAHCLAIHLRPLLAARLRAE